MKEFLIMNKLLQKQDKNCTKKTNIYKHCNKISHRYGMPTKFFKITVAKGRINGGKLI
jgi:hypothetical protein